ncbi:DUF6538 domain-containing protein [Methylobacterium radiodurans]|uniref:Integrase n=1 Tax=Methylobacterium radiodurans TaxID=2202828 RepID=A0A2U8VQA9_9HYPH|nr:DUF6538 domain-containing protein [Methylobacterium radiodurans]AWN35837.1 integrase [Methylobacterium radiodurans]
MARMAYRTTDRNGTLYFRRVIPAELRPFMPAPWTGKANWTKSLGTKEARKAVQPYARCLSDCEADFTAAERAKRGEKPIAASHRRSAMPPLEEIEADVLAELLAADDAARTDGDARKQLQTAEERACLPHLEAIALGGRWMEEDFFEGYGEELELLHGDYARALARQNPQAVDAECRAFLRRRGLPIEPDSGDYREAALAVLRAHVRAYEAKLERHRGKVIATPAPRRGRGPTLSEAYAAWRSGSGARGSKKPGERTLLEADYAVRRLTEWHGDIRLGDLTREKARDFRDNLARVPTRLPGDLKRLPMRDLLKRDLGAYAPQHAATINKTLNILAAIANHAEAAGSLDGVPDFKNPFGKGTKLVVDARAEEKRQSFSPGDLKAIFGTGVYQSGERPRGGGGEAAFWLPLLALLSGARQGELAQLRIMDLAQDREVGVWLLDISTAGGRSIKTASSRRKIPVHPELERIGLLRYRQSLLDSGAKPDASLWPHVEADRTGHGRNGSTDTCATRQALRTAPRCSTPSGTASRS